MIKEKLNKLRKTSLQILTTVNAYDDIIGEYTWQASKRKKCVIVTCGHCCESHTFKKRKNFNIDKGIEICKAKIEMKLASEEIDDCNSILTILQIRTYLEKYKDGDK